MKKYIIHYSHIQHGIKDRNFVYQEGETLKEAIDVFISRSNKYYLETGSITKISFVEKCGTISDEDEAEINKFNEGLPA